MSPVFQFHIPSPSQSVPVQYGTSKHMARNNTQSFITIINHVRAKTAPGYTSSFLEVIFSEKLNFIQFQLEIIFDEKLSARDVLFCYPAIAERRLMCIYCSLDRTADILIPPARQRWQRDILNWTACIRIIHSFIMIVSISVFIASNNGQH